MRIYIFFFLHVISHSSHYFGSSTVERLTRNMHVHMLYIFRTLPHCCTNTLYICTYNIYYIYKRMISRFHRPHNISLALSLRPVNIRIHVMYSYSLCTATYILYVYVYNRKEKNIAWSFARRCRMTSGVSLIFSIWTFFPGDGTTPSKVSHRKLRQLYKYYIL